jgi:MoaA/NifB/PqqE/SkfB family radical SAM enzyme
LLESVRSNQDLVQTITTNGLLLDERWAERLVELGRIEVTFSFDSIDARTYEHVRRGASFETFRRNLKAFARTAAAHRVHFDRYGLWPSANFIVMKSNHREIEDLFPFARDYGIRKINLLSLNAQRQDFFDLERPDREALSSLRRRKPRFERLARSTGVDFEFRFAVDEEPAASGRGRPGAASLPPCPAPWDSMELRDPEVRPYCECLEAAGRIDEGSAMGIWSGEGFRRYRSLLSVGASEGLCSSACPVRAMRLSQTLV